MNDATADKLLDSTLSKLNGAAGDIAALVADGDDAYLLKVAKLVEDDLLATAQRFLLADSSPLFRREVAIRSLVAEFDRNVTATVLLARVVGDVQAGEDRIRPDRLLQAATSAAQGSIRVRDQALALLTASPSAATGTIMED